MVKNVSNELRFWQDMYFYEFYQIPEDFWKIYKIGRFLAEKRSFRAFCASRFRNFFFDGNRIRAFKNAQIRLKISIVVAYYVFNKSYLFLLDNFKFWRFYMRSKLSRGLIFVKIGKKWPKTAYSATKKKYRKIAIFQQTSTHVCVYKSRTVDFSI